MAKLFLIPRGRLGNQMLQLIFAISLQDQVPDLEVFGYDMPLWGLVNPGRMGWPPLTPSLRLRETDGIDLAPLFHSGLLRRAKVRDVPMRCTQFSLPSRFSDMFPIQSDSEQITGANEILIHVRGDDILSPTHSDYGPIPVDWYRKLVAKTGLSPVFLGQLGDDYYSNLLKQSFPQARFVGGRGILADFDAIRLAPHVALSVSTFAWLAAWLSKAESIHLPVFGIFNPNQRPDIWMLPLKDNRYHFHRFAIRRWTANLQQISELDDPCTTHCLSTSEVMTLADEIAAARSGRRAQSLRRLRIYSALSWFPA